MDYSDLLPCILCYFFLKEQIFVIKISTKPHCLDFYYDEEDDPWKLVYFDGNLGCYGWTVTPSSMHPLYGPSSLFGYFCIFNLWTSHDPCIFSRFYSDGPPCFWQIFIIFVEFDSTFDLPIPQSLFLWPTTSPPSHSAFTIYISCALLTLH